MKVIDLDKTGNVIDLNKKAIPKELQIQVIKLMVDERRGKIATKKNSKNLQTM